MRKETAWQKASNTDRWTEILFRALTSRVVKRWRLISFRGLGGGEWCGIVDVLAIRKDTTRSTHEILKSGDLFEIILVQMKGGSARWPSAADIQRLKRVANRYKAKGIVLFTWQRGKGCKFLRLGPGDKWVTESAREIFG
jgi:hypothetical protein